MNNHLVSILNLQKADIPFFFLMHIEFKKNNVSVRLTFIIYSDETNRFSFEERD